MSPKNVGEMMFLGKNGIGVISWSRILKVLETLEDHPTAHVPSKETEGLDLVSERRPQDRRRCGGGDGGYDCGREKCMR